MPLFSFNILSTFNCLYFLLNFKIVFLFVWSLGSFLLGISYSFFTFCPLLITISYWGFRLTPQRGHAVPFSQNNFWDCGLYFKTKGVCMYNIVYNYKIGYTFSKYFLIFPWHHSFSISLLQSTRSMPLTELYSPSPHSLPILWHCVFYLSERHHPLLCNSNQKQERDSDTQTHPTSNLLSGLRSRSWMRPLLSML